MPMRASARGRPGAHCRCRDRWRSHLGPSSVLTQVGALDEHVSPNNPLVPRTDSSTAHLLAGAAAIQAIQVHSQLIGFP
jgi:hypothetical protein